MDVVTAMQLRRSSDTHKGIVPINKMESVWHTFCPQAPICMNMSVTRGISRSIVPLLTQAQSPPVLIHTILPYKHSNREDGFSCCNGAVKVDIYKGIVPISKMVPCGARPVHPL